MKVLLKCDIPKRGFNAKFEHRWTKAKLGIEVNNWQWDGQVGSHVLDNRHNINSLKFQAFVNFGQDSYDHHISPQLEARKKGGYAVNQIKDIDLGQLMLYCGMDSLLEWKLAERQMERIGYVQTNAVSGKRR